jgi:hypothetical protein
VQSQPKDGDLIVLITVVHENGYICITDCTSTTPTIELQGFLLNYPEHNLDICQMGDQMVVHDIIITMNTDISCGFNLIISPLTCVLCTAALSLRNITSKELFSNEAEK